MAEPGTLQKGQSGNPGGRPAVAKEIKALARERTPEAMDALAQHRRAVRRRHKATFPRLEFRGAAQRLRLVSAMFWMRWRQCLS
jgi:hypothetical protein